MDPEDEVTEDAGTPEVPDVVETAEVAETPEPEAAETTEVEDVPEEPAPPGVDDFAWDTWDGSLESIPDGQRGWIEKALDWSNGQQAEKDAEVARLREQYAAWMDGLEDPRLAELQAKIESGTAKQGEVQSAYDTLKTEFDEYVAGVNAYIEADQLRVVEAFKAENPTLFDGGEVEAAAVELDKEGWPMRFLPIVVKLKPSALKAAKEKFGSRADLPLADREDRANLVLEAVAASSGKPSRSNASTELVAGTETTTSQSPRVEAETDDTGSFREQKLRFARRNIKRARGT